jgi:uncharacterized membrane protein YesL
MKTMKIQFAETISAPGAPLPVRVTRLIWEHLLVLLYADVLLCAALVPAVLIWLMGLPLLAPWVAALTLGPAWAATSAIANSLVRDETATWRDLLLAGKHHWRAAVGVSLVPALVCTLLLGTWSILVANPRMTWLYAPFFVDGCVVTLVLLASLSAFPLSVTCELRGLRLWKVAFAVTMLRPLRLLGVLALFLLLALALLLFNAGLLPLLCAPLAVFLAALTNQTCESLTAHETQV